MVSLGVNLCLSTASYGVDSSGRYSNENRVKNMSLMWYLNYLEKSAEVCRENFEN